MIHIIVNGILVEAESIVEAHAYIEIRRVPIKQHVTRKTLKENDTITQIMREVWEEIEKSY